MPQSSVLSSLIVTQTRRALSGRLSDPSASSTTRVKSRMSPCFDRRSSPIDRDADFEKVEWLVVIRAARIVVGVLGHLVDPALHKLPGGRRIRHLLPPHEDLGQLRHHGVLGRFRKCTTTKRQINPWHSDLRKLRVAIARRNGQTMFFSARAMTAESPRASDRT